MRSVKEIYFIPRIQTHENMLKTENNVTYDVQSVIINRHIFESTANPHKYRPFVFEANLCDCSIIVLLRHGLKNKFESMCSELVNIVFLVPKYL
jgi:hypothetical protein